MIVWIIGGMVVALAGGIYVGLGLPGLPGREDRVVPHGRARRMETKHIHWFKPDQRRR
jgi:hypothetical protein